MMERRNLVGGGLLAGAAALLGEGVPAAAAAQRGDNDVDAVVSAIDRLKDAVQQRLAVPPELRRIRDQQHTYLKSNQKFPDFIEVGIDIWESVHDWHVRHQQPISMTRAADGRYVMTVMFTTLILRPDQAGNYVGFAFDTR